MNRPIPGAAALVLAAVLLARPAGAADLADEAQFHFERGNQFYRQARFEEALGSYYASNRLVANRNVQFNIARCLEQLRRYDEAFRAWSALDAQADLPEAERTAIRGSIDRLRPHLALLQVTSQPPGAIIYVNRRDLGSLGQTPKRLALPEGKATLILELAGYRPVEVPVELAKGKEIRVEPTLERIYGRLELRRLPADAVVRRDFVDGEVILRGSGVVQLLPGRQVLFVSAPGFQTARLEPEVRPDATVPVDVPLAPAPAATGAVVVRANIDGSLVRIDGREMGFTPAVIEDVPVGTREVEVSKDGRQTFRRRVEVRQGERTYLDVRLRRADPEVSAATKNLVRAEEAPASITVITADEIAAFGWTTLADALAGVRGVFSSNDRIYESVGFRGFSPPGDYTNRVLVLVDGHPYNDVLAGQGFVGHDLDVDLATVDRIEVVRGPGSVLYGTGALFGVINVVTRRPAADAQGEVGGQLGTLGTTRGRATVTARRGPVEVLASAAVLKQLGDRRFAWAPEDGRPGAVAIRADLEEARHADLAARLGPLALRAGYNERDKTVPTGAFETNPGPDTRYRDVRAWTELRLERPLGPVRLAARAAYDVSRFHGRYALLPDAAGEPREDIEDRHRAQWTTGELRLGLPTFLGQRLTVGGEVQSQFELDLGGPSTDAQREAGADRELVLSGYLVDDWAVTGWLRLNLGLRADHYRNSFGSTLNPRLAVIAQPYQGGNTKVFAGRAFRAPSPYERFYNDGAVTQRQAGDLEPEAILSADLEHAHAVDDDAVVVGTAFVSEVRNLIVLDGAEGDLLAYRNHPDRVRSHGLGAEVRWEPGAGTMLVLAYSWQRVRSRGEEGDRPFPNAPAHLASLRALYALVPGRLRLGNEVLLDVGRRTRHGDRVDDALVWNVTFGGEHRPWRLRWFAGVFNLLDVRGYGPGFPVGDEVPSPTVPRYGRSVRAGLSVAF